MLVDSLLRQSRLYEAYRIFNVRADCSPPSWGDFFFFTDLLKNVPRSVASVVTAITADLQLCKARWIHENKPAQTRLRDKLLSSAVKNYNRCSHGYGLLDARYFKAVVIDSNGLLSRLQSVDSLLVKIAETLGILVNEYEEAKFPTRQIVVMDGLAQIFARMNDVRGIYEAHKHLRELCEITGRMAKYWTQ